MLSMKARLEARKVYGLGIPLIISQVAIVGMSTTDTIMAGWYGTNDLAGVAVATGLWFPLLVLLIGIISGVAPFFAQGYGGRNHLEIARVFEQGVWLTLGLSAIVCAILLIGIPYVELLGEAPSVTNISSGYLSAIVFGVPGLALSILGRCLCEAHGNTRTPMLINLVAFVVNILLDYVFVFGFGDWEGFGGIGCGWATATIYWLTAIALLRHVAKSRRYQKVIKEASICRPDFQRQKDIIKVGLPSSIGTTAEVSFFAMVAVMLVPYGADTVAAHQIAMNVASIIFMIPLGTSMAIGIRAAHLIGEGNYHHARFSSFLTVKLAAATAVVTAIATLLFKDTITTWYTSDVEVIRIASTLLIYSAIFQFIDSIQVICAGALRGYKDTRIPMLMQIFSYWCAGFFVSWSLSIGAITGTDWGAEGYWMGFVAGLSVAGLLLLQRLNRVTKRAKTIHAN